MISLARINHPSTTTVDPTDFAPDLRNLENATRGCLSERTEIAVVVWRICTEFLADHSPLAIAPGQVLAEAAEEYVRTHAEEVEARTIVTWDGVFPAVVMEVLHDFGLADDYMRMKVAEQHMAFAA